MKNTSIVCAFLSLFAFTGSAFAGETNVFIKTGYFSWNESTTSRSNFMSENGIAVEPGIGYTARVIPFVALTGSTSVKVAGTVYTGSADVYGKGDMTTGRANISIKSELKVTGEIPATEKFLIGPVAGVQFEELFRPVAEERWDIATAKAGLKGSYGTVTVEAGVSMPFYTVNHCSANLDLNLEPTGMVSPYSEAKYSFSNGKSIRIFFEQNRWSASDWKMQRKTEVLASGVVINSTGGARQPDSVTRFIGLQFDWWI